MERLHHGGDGIFSLFRGAGVGTAAMGFQGALGAVSGKVGAAAPVGYHVGRIAALDAHQAAFRNRQGQLEVQNFLFSVDGGKIRVGGKAEDRQLLGLLVVVHVVPVPAFLTLPEDQPNPAVQGNARVL